MPWCREPQSDHPPETDRTKEAQSTSIDLLRHAVATLAYRARKPLKDAPEEMDAARLCEGGMSGREVVDHMSDVLLWGAGHVSGNPRWATANSPTWEMACDRFWTALAGFDLIIDTHAEDCPVDRILQGPVADCLTHVGQLATLRRMAGAPIEPENYFKAEIEAGHVDGP